MIAGTEIGSPRISSSTVPPMIASGIVVSTTSESRIELKQA